MTDKTVSILTGPLGPVQPVSDPERVEGRAVFQSSPALWGRCNQEGVHEGV